MLLTSLLICYLSLSKLTNTSFNTDPWEVPLYSSIFPIFVSYSSAKYQFMKELLNFSGIFTERPLEISTSSFHSPHCTGNSHPEQLPGFRGPNRPGAGSELRYKEQL